MNQPISLAAGAAAAFAVLFSVPLALSAVLSVLGMMLGDEAAGPSWSTFLSGARFAAAWALGFVPCALLAARGGPSVLAWAPLGIGAVGFVRGLAFAANRDPFPTRLLWATLEAVLLAAAFRTFIFTVSILAST